MGSVNELIQIREAFGIPESVTILATTQIYNRAAIELAKQKEPTAPATYTIDQTVTQDNYLYLSALGTPVYTNIEFLSDSYETNVKGLSRTTPNLKYEAILITVSQAKKIIKTEIQGRNGTVKEYIGLDDYNVTINGVITGKNGHYPNDEVAFLKQILDAPIPIPVASSYLYNLGINSLVIESYELAQEAGGYSYQTFSISCVSDLPQELKLTNV